MGLLSLSQECQTAVLKLLLKSLMVYPQNLACAPKIMTQRVHIPSAEYWSGHAVLMGIHIIGFYEELSKISDFFSAFWERYQYRFNWEK